MEKLEMYEIGSSALDYNLIERIIKDGTKLKLSEEAKKRIQKCRDYLDAKTDRS